MNKLPCVNKYISLTLIQVIWTLIKTLNFVQGSPQNINIPKTTSTHAGLCPGMGLFIQEEKTALSLDSKFAHGVEA